MLAVKVRLLFDDSAGDPELLIATDHPYDIDLFEICHGTTLPKINQACAWNPNEFQRKWHKLDNWSSWCFHLPIGEEYWRHQPDLHAFAVLIYMYLLYRHPSRGGKVHDVNDEQRDESLTMGEKALFVEHPSDKSNRIKVADAKPTELPWAAPNEKLRKRRISIKTV